MNRVRALRLEPASDGTNPSPNLIGGSPDNSVTAAVFGAAIGGGGRSNPAIAGSANRVTDNQGTIGGGANNQAGNNNAALSDADQATVGGGNGNTASGNDATVGGGALNTASDTWATVAGGESNTAGWVHATVAGSWSNTASNGESTVAGGSANRASGQGSAVAGGFGNTASGDWSTVAGGLSNSAIGHYSFAAGSVATAAHPGAFVWADNSASLGPTSTAANQFIARAAGHFFLQSDSTLHDQGGLINTSTGAFLSTGGTWTNNSDRRLKHQFARLRPGSVLRKLTRLPVRSWSYKAEPGVRHIGPVAQDFRRLFRVGADNRHIGSVDADGVALAAIKALAAQNRRLNHRLLAESRRRSRQARRIARLERGLAALQRRRRGRSGGLRAAP